MVVVPQGAYPCLASMAPLANRERLLGLALRTYILDLADRAWFLAHRQGGDLGKFRVSALHVKGAPDGRISFYSESSDFSGNGGGGSRCFAGVVRGFRPGVFGATCL
jgi:hypothetical protein